MKKNPSSKTVPTVQQANYVHGLQKAYDQLLLRVSSLEIRKGDLEPKESEVGIPDPLGCQQLFRQAFRRIATLEAQMSDHVIQPQLRRDKAQRRKAARS